MKLIKQTIQKLGVFAIALSAFTSCLPEHDIPPSPDTNLSQDSTNTGGGQTGGGQANLPSSLHLTLGGPTMVSVAPNTDKDNYYIDKTQYVMSYNNSRGTANWVAWHLQDTDLGTGRFGTWKPESLPSGFNSVGTSYQFSTYGFDRGHMCPSGDRNTNKPVNQTTFTMANAIPQAQGNNQGPWGKFENYCRELARSSGKELYIYAGVYGQGGIGSKSSAVINKIGNVTVPSNTWKVILILDKGDNDVARIDENTKVIAVDMPNIEEIKPKAWTNFTTSVDEIERQAGVDFFQVLSKDLQDKLEAKIH